MVGGRYLLKESKGGTGRGTSRLTSWQAWMGCRLQPSDLLKSHG